MGQITEHEKRFAGRVRKVRVHRGLSCQKLADRIGMMRVALSKIECGARRVSLGEAVDIAQGLHVELTDMLSTKPLVVREQSFSVD